MSAYSQILYQIVFSTKYREKTLLQAGREPMYRYMSGILKEKNCHLFKIGGIEDHIHIVTHIHPMVAPALLIKDIKLAASEFIRREKLFPDFRGWQVGYGAFTYSINAKENLVRYVMNQEAHHQKQNSKDEYIMLLRKHGVEYDERYLL